MADPAGFVDYYSQCEQALATFLRSSLPDQFKNEWQVTDNESDLVRGADYYILFRPGAIPDRPVTFHSGSFTYWDWRVNVNLFTRYLEKKLQWPQFKRFRALVLFVLEHNQLLPNNSNVEKIVSYSAPEDALYWKFKNTPADADPNMMTQPLSVVLRQRIDHNG
jgi:hypothetical protein